MKLTVSCPSCGKQFRNIKPELAGKKARCRCGTVVRLGTKPARREMAAEQPPSTPSPPADLLNVDLLGLEMLGDQMLGGDLVDSKTQTVPPSADARSGRDSNTPADDPPARQTVKPRQTPPPRQSSPGSSKSQRNRKAGRPHSRPSKQSETSQRKKNQSNSKQHRKERELVPQVPLTVAVKPNRSSKRSGEQPMFEQSYGDLDAILDGAGDATPLVVRPQPKPESVPKKTKSAVSNPVSIPPVRGSTLGFLAALGSSTLAFWFGLLVVVSRIQAVDVFPVGRFSSSLQAAYQVSFGESTIPQSFQLVFLTLGWLLWCAAFVLVLLAIGQFVNAFARLFTGRDRVGWSDGLVAALGVTLVFLLVGLVFCQTSYANYENRQLDIYEQPVVEDGEHLESVERIRAQVQARNRSFTLSLLLAAVVPMGVFVLSITRLFTKNSQLSNQAARIVAP